MADPGSDIKLAFFFGAVKSDWLLILALQTTFNVYYFFYGASYKLITIYSCNDDYHRQKHNKELFFSLACKNL
jgi:hypothetical protein